MRRLPEKWTLLVRNPNQVQDPSTGNWFPGPPTRVPWTGLLQQRQLSAASVDAGNTEFAADHVVSSYVLLLDPGLTPFPTQKDAFEGPEGGVYQIEGRPRPRKQIRGDRRERYIAANVRAVSDMKE
ncbi:hypothetical protein A6411_10700 [Prescottella equi]|uniref:hypothetical protein n=1 Tax=Rhodococcus hoagii TaxID=43767 RepID=UPI0009BDD8B0|nr:hypothetical protein [Prescottella equi]OQQ32267.1 hypothetical protein A6411_10700 [Prescottella equi]